MGLRGKIYYVGIEPQMIDIDSLTDVQWRFKSVKTDHHFSVASFFPNDGNLSALQILLSDLPVACATLKMFNRSIFVLFSLCIYIKPTHKGVKIGQLETSSQSMMFDIIFLVTSKFHPLEMVSNFGPFTFSVWKSITAQFSSIIYGKFNPWLTFIFNAKFPSRYIWAIICNVNKIILYVNDVAFIFKSIPKCGFGYVPAKLCMFACLCVIARANKRTHSA